MTIVPSVMVNASHGPAGETSARQLEYAVSSNDDDRYLHFAPLVAAEASIVGLFQLLMVSRTPSSSSPRVVKPVTLRPAITDFPVEGSMMPGKMAPPWQLQGYVSLPWPIKQISHGCRVAYTADTMPPSV